MLFPNDFYNPFEELSRAVLGEFDGLGRRLGFSGPNLNLYESENAYTAELAVPGFRPESLDVRLDGNVLVISGERPAPENDDGRKYAWSERTFGKFTRKIRLGRDVNREGIRADYRDGILTLTLPKAEEAKPRKIAIQAS